jgi:L-lysine cyclodeaminase
MDQTIESLERALRDFDDFNIEIRPRDGFQWTDPRPGVFEWMPIMRKRDRAIVKMVAYNPGNPELFNIPTIIATNSVYDMVSGHLIAIIDGVFATALRTGAASAVATKYMGKPGSSIVGLVGCGAQAVTQLHALSRILDIDEALIFDINPQAESSFVDRCSFLNIPISPVPLEILEASADIICTATTVNIGEGPVIADSRLKPHIHINAVGSDLPGKLELPFTLVNRSFVCPDYPEQAFIEGECQQVRREQVGPGLIELVKNPSAFETFRQAATIFDSTGFSLEDQVVTEMLLAHASELGLGHRVVLENTSTDALNPYEGLTHMATSISSM